MNPPRICPDLMDPEKDLAWKIQVTGKSAGGLALGFGEADLADLEPPGDY